MFAVQRHSSSFSEKSGSKMLWQAGLLENAVGRVARLYLAIYREMYARVRGEPDVVVTLARADEAASGFEEQSLELRGKIAAR